MARTMVEDSATAQFFINVADNDALNYAPGNPGYAVFGKVVEGMDVVDKIAKVETNSQDKPLEDVKIINATVI
jgi:cyclophilin family peptidyl-prolyl cis-trans isomerase